MKREDRDVLDRLRDCMEMLDRLLFYYERGFTPKIRGDVKKLLDKSRRAFDRKCNEIAETTTKAEDPHDKVTRILEERIKARELERNNHVQCDQTPC